MTKNRRNWYRIIVTVYRNSDGHILRDSQELLIDGTNRKIARSRAIEILNAVHDSETHTITVGDAYQL